jgi:hypothetical protein
MTQVPDDKHLGRVGRDELIGLVRRLEKERDEVIAQRDEIKHHDDCMCRWCDPER